MAKTVGQHGMGNLLTAILVVGLVPTKVCAVAAKPCAQDNGQPVPQSAAQYN